MYTTSPNPLPEAPLCEMPILEGSLEEWLSVPAALSGNPYAMFCLCAAFVGPLLRPLGLPSYGIHFLLPNHYETRQSSEFAFAAAMSVWGAPRPADTRWKVCGRENQITARIHNDLTLFTSGDRQTDKAELARSARALVDERKPWRLFFVSSGGCGLLEEDQQGTAQPSSIISVDLTTIPSAPLRPASPSSYVPLPYGCAGLVFQHHLSDIIYGAPKESLFKLLSKACRTVSHHPGAEAFCMVLLAGWLGCYAGLLPWTGRDIEDVVKDYHSLWRGQQARKTTSKNNALKKK